ncbi:hypothetical protein D3C87_1485060 [compost metagenome]
MQIEIMRHHRRAQNAKRQIEHLGVGDDLRRRRKTTNHLAPVGIGQRQLNGETHRDDAEKRDDKRFHPAEAKPLQIKDQEHVKRRDEDAEFERNAENQVETDRCTDDLGDISRDDCDFGQQPQHHRHRFRIGIATGLRQIAPGSNRQTGTERL